MTTERLVKLERMAMYSKSLASISDNSVLNAFISSGPRKLNYRRYYLLVLTGNIQKNYPTQKIEVRLVAIKSDYFSSFFANTPFNLKNVITSFTQLFTSVVRLIAIQVGHSYLHSMYVQRNLGVFRFINMGFTTVKPLITNTSEEFIKCRLDNFSLSFILYYVNISICENK